MPSETSFAAFVPMKGHSERVPNKNIRPLAGRPLYHWIVSALAGVEAISTIVVDTDSDEIAEMVTKDFPQVRIVWRPEELRGDFVPMHDVLRHDVQQVDEHHLLQTHSTNPLLRSETIARALERFLEDDEHDSLFGVTPWQTRFYWGDGRPVNHDPAELLRTQDLPPIFEENSNLYVFDQDVIADTGQRVGRKPAMFPIDRAEAIDIDEETDFYLADCLARRRLEQEAGR